MDNQTGITVVQAGYAQIPTEQEVKDTITDFVEYTKQKYGEDSCSRCEFTVHIESDESKWYFNWDEFTDLKQRIAELEDGLKSLIKMIQPNNCIYPRIGMVNEDKKIFSHAKALLEEEQSDEGD